MRRGLTGHLYRRFLADIMDRIDDERLPEDWLALSSGETGDFQTAATAFRNGRQLDPANGNAQPISARLQQIYEERQRALRPQGSN